MPGLMGKLPTFPKTYNVYFLAIVSTLGGTLFGFDISSMSAIVGTDQYIDYFHNPAGAYQGAIGSALAAGSIIGCLIAGPISDRIGRRDACLFACLWWLAGTSVQVATTSRAMLIAGRMLNGVCVGITSSQVPVYLAEIAKKNMRGSILVIQQLAIEVRHPGHVLHRLRLLLHPRTQRLVQDRVGYPVHPLRFPDRGPAFPAPVAALAG